MCRSHQGLLLLYYSDIDQQTFLNKQQFLVCCSNFLTYQNQCLGSRQPGWIVIENVGAHQGWLHRDSQGPRAGQHQQEEAHPAMESSAEIHPVSSTHQKSVSQTTQAPLFQTRPATMERLDQV